MLKSAGISLCLGIVWVVTVQVFKKEPYDAFRYLHEGCVWMLLALPIIFCLMKEIGHAHVVLSALFCAFLFGLPFLYAALFAAFPDLILLVVLVTISLTSLIGMYPAIMYIYQPINEETT